MVVLGQEKQRLECLLRVMVASETACPGLWSSDDALEEMSVMGIVQTWGYSSHEMG